MNKPLILVVEDDPPVRNLITTTLKTNNYRYLAAANGEAAIMEASSHNPDIVLLDEPTSFLDLPNRYELCSLLRRLAHEEGKCILFSTHELDIALSLCDAVALIDPPRLHCLPTDEMIRSGRIERLFGRSAVRFDAATGTVKIVR